MKPRFHMFDIISPHSKTAVTPLPRRRTNSFPIVDSTPPRSSCNLGTNRKQGVFLSSCCIRTVTIMHSQSNIRWQVSLANIYLRVFRLFSSISSFINCRLYEKSHQKVPGHSIVSKRRRKVNPRVVKMVIFFYGLDLHNYLNLTPTLIPQIFCLNSVFADSCVPIDTHAKQGITFWS